MILKKTINKDVLTSAKERINFTFDNFEKIYLSFSGGKDSSVMFHLVMDEAIKRNKRIGVMYIDFEAQYKHTINHCHEMFDLYRDHIDLYWICLPIKLRNAVSNFEPCWTCWDESKKDLWIRDFPKNNNIINDVNYFDFFVPNMEFEEFIVLFGLWYGQSKKTAAFIGIRADESLNRFRTIAVNNKETYMGKRYTTKIEGDLYNIYPLYDWKTSDIWCYHAKNKGKPHNAIYDLMHQAGVPLSKQRLCQPYGDDQRRGLWLYHILEPQTWYKIVARVSGVNGGALYIEESGNITGYGKIKKPDGHTYKSFCNLLLSTMPKVSQDHFANRFKRFISGWKKRGYKHGIPDEAPKVLENKQWAPSWRRLCKVLLRNDWWCKGLGMTQPKSEAYNKYLQLKTKKHLTKN